MSQSASRMPGMEQTPTVGRIVHYQSYGSPGGEYRSEPRAAIITEVGADLVVGLAVMNPTGMFFNRSIRYDADGAPGTRWPPRV